VTDAEGVKKAAILRPPTAESQRWAEPLIARLATETWRLGRRLERVGDDERLRALHDSRSRLEDALTEYGVETIEHEGQTYDAGLRVEVLHEGETDGNPVIVETIRPTILLAGRVLQQGQVVTGGAQ
jgi:hypothetical protein